MIRQSETGYSRATCHQKPHLSLWEELKQEGFVLALFEAPLAWMHGTLGDAHHPAQIGQMLLRYVLLVGGEVFFLENNARKPQRPEEDPFSLLWLQNGEH